MARIFVIDPVDHTGGAGSIGAHCVCAALRKEGHDAIRCWRSHGRGGALWACIAETWTVGAASIPPPDAVFVSIMHPRQYRWIPVVLRDLGIEPLRDNRAGEPPVCAGGQAAYYPAPFRALFDVVAVGDGEITAPALASAIDAHNIESLRGSVGILLPGDESVTPARIDRLSVSVIHPITRKSPIVEVARGCRNRCRYCSVGWTGGRYRETSASEIIDIVERGKHKTVNFFSPEFSSYSGRDAILAWANSREIRLTNRDARLELSDSLGGSMSSVQSGVEGFSSRLRTAIGRPKTNEEIVASMQTLASRGVTRVKWYVIPGLPGETDEDFAEFLSLLHDVREVYRSSLVFTVTHFRPIPHTPMQYASAHYSEDAARRCAELKAMLKSRWIEGHERWLMFGFSGQEGHERETGLMRSGDIAARLCDGDYSPTPGALDAIGDGPTPWDMVRVENSSSLRRHWDAYLKAIE